MLRPVLLAALALLAASAPAADARARIRCEGTFQKSCVRVLYRCFDGTGVCTRDLGRFFTDGVVTDCWENGTRATVTGLRGGAGTSMVTNRRGRVCLRGTSANAVGFGGIEITYRRGRRRWRIVRDGSGAFTVTCPNGKTEAYAAAEVAASGCGPIVDCAAGTCP